MALADRPNTSGLLGYYHLLDWWKNDFNNDEQLYILARYKPMGGSGLINGTLSSSSASSINFLTGLQTWFTNLTDKVISEKILKKAETLITEETAILDIHFLYNCLLKHYYKKRNIDNEFYELAKVYCKKQIEISQKVKDTFITEPWFTVLPRHKGFEQLAIIFEKEKRFAGAIQLCVRGKEMGWNGDWDKRISNLENKLARNSIS